MSSICIIDTTVNGSYTVSTSTSAGSSPAILNAGGAANTCGVDVKAGCWLQWPPDVAGSVDRRGHERRPAVRDEARVEHAQRVGEHRGGQVVLQGHPLVVHDRFGMEVGVP